MDRKFYKSIIFFGAVSLLTGCLSTSPSLLNDTCGARNFQSFVGQPVSAFTHKILRVGAKDGVSIYGESQVPAKTVPSDTLGSITYKNKFDVASKSRLLVIYDDNNGIQAYQGSNPKAKFIGAVENKITRVSCGRR